MLSYYCLKDVRLLIIYILQRNFDQRRMIIRSLFAIIVKGPQLKSSDEEEISQLPGDVRICQMSSSEQRSQTHINSKDTKQNGQTRPEIFWL